MVWIIQMWAAGAWHNLRNPATLVTIWYSRKSAAQIALRSLPAGNRYRITQIKD